MDVLNRIMRSMKATGVTQRALTSELGLDENAFGAWKRGDSASYKKYLYQIADFLGVSVEYLRGETDDPDIRKAPAEAGDSTGASYSDEVRAIADDIMGLSPDRQEIARALVASLKQQQQTQPR